MSSPSTPSSKQRKSVFETIKTTYSKVSHDKRVQRLLIFSSVSLATFDLLTDWSVAINYLQRNKDNDATYAAIFISFIVFHGVVSLGYHIAESRELKQSKKEHKKELQHKDCNNNTNNNSDNDDDKNEQPQTISTVANDIPSLKEKSALKSASDLEIPSTSPRNTTDNDESISTEIAIFTETSLWQFPFFLIGLGTLAACIKCFIVGDTDQLWEENRYFEVLFESIPIACLSLYAFLETQDYSNIILVGSICISVLSVAYGTGWYFSRDYSKGNPLEFKPLIESSYLYIELGLLTLLDYITRVVSPILLFRTDWVNEKSPVALPLLLIFIILALPEILAVTWIHGSFVKFGAPFGWFAIFTVSVPIFAGIATRFENFVAFWIEIIARGGVNLACVVLTWYLDWDSLGKKAKNELYAWIWITISCFVTSNLLIIHFTFACKKVIDDLPIPKSRSILGTRNAALSQS